MRPNDKTWWEKAFPAAEWFCAVTIVPGFASILLGITLAAYLLPAALGDASLARLPSEAGLYACLFGGLVFWLFCSSRQTSITVTSAISLLIGSSLGEHGGRGHGASDRRGGLQRRCSRRRSLSSPGWRARARAVRFISESVMTGFKRRRRAAPRQHATTEALRRERRARRSSGTRMHVFLQHLGETNPTSILARRRGPRGCSFSGKNFCRYKPIALFVVVAGIAVASFIDLPGRASV